MSWFDFLILGFFVLTFICVLGRPINSKITIAHIIMSLVVLTLGFSALQLGVATDGFLARVVPIGPRHDPDWPDRDFMTNRMEATSPLLALPKNRGTRAALRSTFKVGVSKCGRGGYGSGWVWKRGEAVTNAHVAASSKEITLFRQDGSSAPSRLLRVDRKRDIAIISAPLDWKPIPISLTDGYGWSVGYPGGGSRLIQPTSLQQIYGKFSGPGNTFSSWQKLLQGGSTIYQGMSGGPIIDKNGNAVGINSMFLDGGIPNLLAIPAVEIQKVGKPNSWTNHRCSLGGQAVN